MWLATPPAARRRRRRLGHRPRRRASRGAASRRSPFAGAVARTLAAPDVARRRARRRVSGSLLRRAAEPLNALNLNIVNLSFLLLGFAAAWHAGAADARRAGGHAGRVGRRSCSFLSTPASPASSRHASERPARGCVRPHFDAGDVSGARGDLLGGARRLRAVGRIEVGDRGPVRDGGGARAQGASRLGRGVYDLGEALANLVQPFWMLPILGMFGLRARDVMGYTLVVFLALTPAVLLLVTLLGSRCLSAVGKLTSCWSPLGRLLGLRGWPWRPSRPSRRPCAARPSARRTSW